MSKKDVCAEDFVVAFLETNNQAGDWYTLEEIRTELTAKKVKFADLPEMVELLVRGGRLEAHPTASRVYRAPQDKAQQVEVMPKQVDVMPVVNHATQVVRMPEDILPAPWSLAESTELAIDEDTPDGRAFILRKLESSDLGFELAPFSPEHTGHVVRDTSRRVLAAWIEQGAYLLQAKACMGASEFWKWFNDQGFPVSRDVAFRCIQLTKQMLLDPQARKLAGALGSHKRFEVGGRLLKMPSVRQEFDQKGTIDGKSPEELAEMSKRELQEMEKKLKKVEQEALEAKTSLAKKDAELEKANKKLMGVLGDLHALQNPDQAREELTAKVMGEFQKQHGQVYMMLRQYRPSNRRDMEGLTDEALLQLYSAYKLYQLEVEFVLRDMEARWGSRIPELLLADDGSMKSPASRPQLRLMSDQIDKADAAVDDALFKDNRLA